MVCFLRVFGWVVFVLLVFESCFRVDGNDSSLVVIEDSPSSGQQDLKLANVEDRHMVVVTMDGSLHCVGQRTGSLLWRIKDEPLINVTQDNVKEFLLIPNPKDGTLFAYDGNQLSKYPFSIHQLVAMSPSRTVNGILYAGSKKDVWIAINMTTGEKIETVSLDRGYEKTCPAGSNPKEITDVAYIGRSEYSLGVFDSNARQKKWFGSFIDYTSHAQLDAQDYDLRHLATSTGGLLATADERSGDVLWQKDFGSPVAAVFLWDAAGLQRVPFTTFVPDALSLLLNPRDGTSFLKEMTFRQRTMLLGPNIQPILFVGSSKYGAYTMPTLGIKEATNNYLPDETKKMIAAGSVSVSANPTNIPAENENSTSFLVGYYNMPEKNTEISAMFPAHLDMLSPFAANQPLRGLPGPSQEEPPDINHLSGFLFYLLSLLIAVLIAGTASWYFARGRRRNVDSSHSAAQTSRQIGNETDENGRRLYQVGKLQFYPDSILGYGSAGTIVYEGKFDGRKVAVKRLVPELCGLAEKEAQLLRLSDKHSNVIRYFLTERDSHFCYLALELAAGTLADYVEGKMVAKCPLPTLTVIEHMLHGLQHLHGLGIVHRDLKPANVLLSIPESKSARVRAMISDFGLCKRISHTSSWVAKSSSMGRTIGGTEGWIAPEILIRYFPESNNGNKKSPAVDGVVLTSSTPAVTPAVDIFSAGCLMYYALTNGRHPFGEPIRRQVNIQCSKPDFFELLQLGNYTAKDLCEWMVTFDASKRPSVNECLVHPMFWPAAKQLSFLLDISDRLEKVQVGDNHPALTNLERGSSMIVNHDWRRHVGDELQAELRTHRSYRGNSVRDLLRAIRNKKHHYQELPDAVKGALGEVPDGFLTFFTSRFPRLLIHVYRSASCIGDEPALSSYYCKTPPPLSKSHEGSRASLDPTANSTSATPATAPTPAPNPISGNGDVNVSPAGAADTISNATNDNTIKQQQQQNNNNHN